MSWAYSRNISDFTRVTDTLYRIPEVVDTYILNDRVLNNFTVNVVPLGLFVLDIPNLQRALLYTVDYFLTSFGIVKLYAQLIEIYLKLLVTELTEWSLETLR